MTPTETELIKLVNGIEAYILGSARRIAIAFHLCDFDADELAQIGRLTALRAGRLWDPEKGSNFLSYTARSVRGCMCIAAKRLVTPVSGAGSRTISSVSLNYQPEDGGEELGAWLISEDQSTTDAADATDRAEILRQALACLNPQQREVLRLYYTNQLTFEETGARMGYTRQRAEQVHSAAIQRLRKSAILKQVLS